MHTKQYPANGSGPLGGREAADAAERQRRLGRVYRLILNYDPEARAAGQADAEPVTCRAGEAQPEAGQGG